LLVPSHQNYENAEEGKPQKSQKYITYAVSGGLIIFEAFTVGACISFGIVQQDAGHFLLGLLGLSLFGILIVLMRWYQQGDLDPKFKWFIVFVVVVVILTGIMSNMYIWKPQPVFPSSLCDNGMGFYQFNTKNCWSIMNSEFCYNPRKDFCVKTQFPGSSFCTNCTTPHVTPSPFRY